MNDPHSHMPLVQKDFRDTLVLHPCIGLNRLNETAHKESIALQTKVPIAVDNELSHVVLWTLITLHGTRPRTQS